MRSADDRVSRRQARVVSELESQTFAVVSSGSALEERLVAARARWGALFTGADKYLLPGDTQAPTGYVPLCMNGGCEMKESYYVRPERKPPSLVADVTHDLVRLLGEIAVSVASEINKAAGVPLVSFPAVGCLRVMRYPAFEGATESGLRKALEADGAVRADAHTDLNALTVLPAATTPGLEIRDGDRWIPAEVSAGEVLVHVGQELEASSGGRWRATEHRVRNPIGSERLRPRLSFAFFVS